MKEYGMQLREKQKVKRMYGVLEKPFRTYFRKAGRKQGVTGENLLMFLETRFDSVVLKLGLASSRWQSRQLIRHNHFEVNGSRVNIPSFQVSQGDIIRVRENSRNKDVITESVEMRSDGQIPDWLDLDRKNLQGTVVNMPTRDSISTPINEQLIIELYSK
jgi:small subunit ribosomal protein S4|tara:strand:- start:211531 stop:212010 length:480 start_codon:yes stop_codon:yes gene_type:complete